MMLTRPFGALASRAASAAARSRNGGQSFSVRRALRCSAEHRYLNDDEKALARQKHAEMVTSKEFFEDSAEKNRETFKNAIDLFNRRDIRKRGQVEFIRAALKNMKAFGVERDLEVYRALIDIMPKEKYVPQTKLQAAFFHYPKHQFCIVEVLSQMTENGVVPDSDLGDLVENIFGMSSMPFKKYMRMVYWMNKQKNLSPWPLPYYLPKDTKELARLAIEQITSVDRHTEVVEYDCEEIPESLDKTWIISGQSPAQREIIKTLPRTEVLYVEGAFRVWLKDAQVNYFILRGKPVPRPPPPEGDTDEVANIKNWTIGQHSAGDFYKEPSVHEQEDGTLLGCCATGTSSKDSLLSWIRFLQRDNPALGEIPIMFTLVSPLGPIVEGNQDEKGLAGTSS